MKNRLFNNSPVYIGSTTQIRRSIIKTLSLGLASIIALTPITSHAVVRDNLSSMDTSATATSSDLLNGETAWVNGSKITGTIPSLAAKTYTPGTTDQTITANQFLSGTQTIKGDSNLVSSNIKSGVTIFGVSGNSNVVDTSAGNATAAQILKDKVAYVGGAKITGSMVNKSGTTTSATTVTESSDGTKAEITIPTAGYYSTTSKISVPIETIKTEVPSSNTILHEKYFTFACQHYNNQFGGACGRTPTTWTGSVQYEGNDYASLTANDFIGLFKSSGHQTAKKPGSGCTANSNSSTFTPITLTYNSSTGIISYSLTTTISHCCDLAVQSYANIMILKIK